MKKLVLVLSFLMLASFANAQKISFDPENGAIGAGVMLTGEEKTTFTWDSSFVAIKWHTVGFANRRVSTGIGVEFHPGAMLSFTEGKVTVNQIDSVNARVWSLNRANTSLLQIPGDVWESMYLGSDLLIYEAGSKDWTGDFSARLVYGVEEQAGPGRIQFEIYMFEKYRPISFAIFYHF